MARILSTLVIALTMFFVPLGMHVGAKAWTATPTVTMDGCEGMIHHGQAEQKADVIANCAVTCAAIPMLSVGLSAHTFFDEVKPRLGPMIRLVGISPQVEVPPPRATSAI